MSDDDSFQDWKKEQKERARKLRREAYLKAKEFQKKREQEVQELIDQGITEEPEDWQPEKKRKIPTRSFKDQHPQAEDSDQEKKIKFDEDLWKSIQKASELEDIRKKAEAGTHLRLVKNTDT